MSDAYVELHAKSFHSFGVGASHAHELLAQAREYGYPALALTDTNLCGALEFARLANSLGVRPITGGELALADGSRLTLLARSRAGYGNISRLFTIANAADRREPRLDPAHLPHHSEGVVLLTGGRGGPISRLATDGRTGEAGELLRRYVEWYGPDSVYVELQQNLLRGDTDRNRKLVRHRAGGRRPRRRDQRRPLPPAGALQAPTRAGGGAAQHHHRPGPAPSPSQPSPAPQVPGRDGQALRRVPGGRVEHPPRRRAVRPSTSAPTWATRCRNPPCRRGTRPRATCGVSATRRRPGATASSVPRRVEARLR